MLSNTQYFKLVQKWLNLMSEVLLLNHINISSIFIYFLFNSKYC